MKFHKSTDYILIIFDFDWLLFVGHKEQGQLKFLIKIVYFNELVTYNLQWKTVKKILVFVTIKLMVTVANLFIVCS